MPAPAEDEEQVTPQVNPRVERATEHEVLEHLQCHDATRNRAHQRDATDDVGGDKSPQEFRNHRHQVKRDHVAGVLLQVLPALRCHGLDLVVPQQLATVDVVELFVGDLTGLVGLGRDLDPGKVRQPEAGDPAGGVLPVELQGVVPVLLRLLGKPEDMVRIKLDPDLAAGVERANQVLFLFGPLEHRVLVGEFSE